MNVTEILFGKILGSFDNLVSAEKSESETIALCRSFNHFVDKLILLQSVTPDVPVTYNWKEDMQKFVESYSFGDKLPDDFDPGYQDPVTGATCAMIWISSKTDSVPKTFWHSPYTTDLGNHSCKDYWKSHHPGTPIPPWMETAKCEIPKEIKRKSANIDITRIY